MNIDKIRQTLNDHRAYLKAEYGVDTIGIFGSYVRGEARETSDLDLLVTFSTKPGLFKFIALENYLSDLLGIHVDLVMPSALKNKIGQQILAEVIPI